MAGRTRAPFRPLRFAALLASPDGPRRLSLQVRELLGSHGRGHCLEAAGDPQGTVPPRRGRQTVPTSLPDSDTFLRASAFSPQCSWVESKRELVSRLGAWISVTLEMAFVPLAACLACGSGPILFTFLERHCMSHTRWKKFTDRQGIRAAFRERNSPPLTITRSQGMWATGAHFLREPFKDTGKDLLCRFASVSCL